MSENVHKGHRERMRQRFLAEGAKGFADHELLELLLYYAVPRGDVNPRWRIRCWLNLEHFLCCFLQIQRTSAADVV